MGAAGSGPRSQAGVTTVAMPNGTSRHDTSDYNNQRLCQAHLTSDSDLSLEEAIQVVPAHTLPVLLAVQLHPVQPERPRAAVWQPARKPDHGCERQTTEASPVLRKPADGG